MRGELNRSFATCRPRASRRQPPSSAADSVRPDTGHSRGRVHFPHRHRGGPGERAGPIFGGLRLRSSGGHELYPRRGVLSHSGRDEYPGEAGQKRSSGWNRHWQLCDNWCGLGDTVAREPALCVCLCVCVCVWWDNSTSTAAVSCDSLRCLPGGLQVRTAC